MNVYYKPEYVSCLSISKMAEKTLKIMLARLKLTLCETDETAGIGRDCVGQILHNNLNIGKVCSKMVPKILTIEKKSSLLKLYECHSKCRIKNDNI
ncbi:hypothetical protein LAZ67_17001214 [Cordylochernes scorpioides]|uniref:Uncharacterized protein n=1 Tax=Cordylochernes scorpioides TaxID=51811 RepID=A0ABY6LD74_9ARAC|nr:hypothetical protein LAZ67_17001214 [Cordylochernes scorpioides]